MEIKLTFSNVNLINHRSLCINDNRYLKITCYFNPICLSANAFNCIYDLTTDIAIKSDARIKEIYKIERKNYNFLLLQI